MPAIPTSRPQLHINYHLTPPCVFSLGTHPITKDIDVSIFIPIGSLSPVTLYSTLFPFSEMSTTPQDPNTLAFLDDADDSSSPMWPRAMPAGSRLPGGMDAAPGTPGASPAGGVVPDTMSGTTVAPQVALLPPVRLVLLPLRTQRPRLLPTTLAGPPAAQPR